MKKLLTVTVCSAALALSSFAQNPPPAAGTTPATTDPAAATGAPTTTAPAPALAPTAPATDPNAPGVVPATGATAPGAAAPAAAATSPAASPAADAAAAGGHGHGRRRSDNPLIDTFYQGGPIMYPILLASIIAVAVVLERVFWWLFRWMRRDPKRIEKVFTAIENGDVTEASRLSRGSRDPVLRMIWNGLNHQHASLQGALQVAAGIEIKRAGRFLVVMDTLITLGPLLGLLGTIVGLMASFASLGNEELAVQAVTGGIAEALIATAAGLIIAIFTLIPFNFFTSRVSNLEFELQTAATNLEVMLEAQKKGDLDITAMTK